MEPVRERRTFPPLRRGWVETLQINLGYCCNRVCLHCHAAAGPGRKQEMPAEVVYDVRLRDLLATAVAGSAIPVADHCFGCTAGQGNGCSGALGDVPAARTGSDG